jgi:hypothetical protein
MKPFYQEKPPLILMQYMQISDPSGTMESQANEIDPS